MSRTKTSTIRGISLLLGLLLAPSTMDFPVRASTISGTTTTITEDTYLGQKGQYPFAGIYEYDNLTIGDNVTIYSTGISQLVIKVNGTLTLGKNAAIRVRNGYYKDAPAKIIKYMTPGSLNTLGYDGGDFRLYEGIFGRGGDGGTGSDGEAGHPTYVAYPGYYIPGNGGNGGSGGNGGYGGGSGGKGGKGGVYGVWGTDHGAPGKDGTSGTSASISDATRIGSAGADSGNGGFAGSGGSNGGRGGAGGNGDSTMALSPSGNGGGGGGYGGGILTIVAKHIVYDSSYPPKFLTSGQVGGKGGKNNITAGEDGHNGEGGLLIINTFDYKYSENHWNLGTQTYGQHSEYISNGGHGIVTGNPQKVVINGVEIINGNEAAVVDLPTAINNAAILLNSTSVGTEEGNVSQGAKDAYSAAINKAIAVRDSAPTDDQTYAAISELAKATAAFKDAMIKSNIMKIGDYVQFGRYYGQPILWRVINVDSEGAPLLLSEKILCLKAYDAKEDYYSTNSDRNGLGSNRWENSNLREWLNSSDSKVTYSTNQPDARYVYGGYNYYYNEPGFLNNFTELERNAVKPVNHKTILADIDTGDKSGGTETFKWDTSMSTFVTNYDTANYKNITDKVFILDVKELHDYVYSRGYGYVKVPTEELLNNNRYYKKENLGYWLRLPIAGTASWQWNVLANGSFDTAVSWIGYDGVTNSCSGGGVVPALALKSPLYNSGSGSIDDPYVVTGEPPAKAVTSIKVTGANSAAAITALKGTLQMSAEVLPIDATDKSVKWSVTEIDGSTATNKAVISADGLLKAVRNGTVKVKAASVSTPYVTGTLDVTISNNPQAGSIAIGDYVQMGKYYDDPILWRCVDMDENGPLMLSDRILTIKPYDAAGNHKYLDGTDQTDDANNDRKYAGSDLWQTSNLRCWLNSTAEAGKVIWLDGCPPAADMVEGDFDSTDPNKGLNAYDMEKGFLSTDNFTTGELNAIKSVAHKSLLDSLDINKLLTGGTAPHIYNDKIAEVVQNYDEAYYQNVTDKIFVLDVKQLNTVYNNSDILGTGYYIGKPTLKAVENSEFKSEGLVSGENWSTWVASPTENFNRVIGSVRVLGLDGQTVILSHPYTCSIGVRPAFYLNQSSVVIKSGDGTEEKPFVVDTAVSCSVTYDSQGGSAAAGTTVSYGSKLAPPAPPTRTGYSFGGWYKEKDCINPFDFVNTIVTGDIALYAKWIPLNDLNNDGIIDIKDIAELAIHYNDKSGQSSWNSIYDLNNDGIVDVYDLVILSKAMN